MVLGLMMGGAWCGRRGRKAWELGYICRLVSVGMGIRSYRRGGTGYIQEGEVQGAPLPGNDQTTDVDAYSEQQRSRHIQESSRIDQRSMENIPDRSLLRCPPISRRPGA